MGVMIQIRNVPTTLHKRLKARAAMAGMSLSDFLLGEITLSAEKLTPDELRERLASRPRAPKGMSPTKALREERDRR